jgi:hypothetical protein
MRSASTHYQHRATVESHRALRVALPRRICSRSNLGSRTRSSNARAMRRAGREDRRSPARGRPRFITNTCPSSHLLHLHPLPPRLIRQLSERQARDRILTIRPSADAPPVLDASLYSILGARVAAVSPIGNAIRFDCGVLADGAYIIVLRTERGMLSYRAMLAR